MSENGGENEARCNGLCTFSAGGSYYDSTCPEHGHLAEETARTLEAYLGQQVTYADYEEAQRRLADPSIHSIVISEATANVLLQICRQSTAHDAKGKIAIGAAQLELEEGLAKLHPPEKPIVIPRAARRRVQKAGMA